MQEIMITLAEAWQMHPSLQHAHSGGLSLHWPLYLHCNTQKTSSQDVMACRHFPPLIRLPSRHAVDRVKKTILQSTLWMFHQYR